MKHLFTSLIISCAALLPVATVNATPVNKVTSFGAKTYGGFKAGYKFNLKVAEVTVIKTAGNVPKSIPKFKKGEKISFTIGAKGQLTAPKKVNIAFKGVSANINEYLTTGKDPMKLTSSGRIVKNPKGKPTEGVLNFNINTLSGFVPNSYQVSYTLEK